MFTEKECIFLSEQLKDTMVSALGIEFLPSDDDMALARMPISPTTRQYFGILHGGASLTLAETLAGAASLHCSGYDKKVCGTNVTGYHVAMSPTSGWVYGKATAIHLGKKTHVWNVDVCSEDGTLISTERVTNVMLDDVKPQN